MARPAISRLPFVLEGLAFELSRLGPLPRAVLVIESPLYEDVVATLADHKGVQVASPPPAITFSGLTIRRRV